MQGHLSDQQWSEALGGNVTAEVREHLARCAACRAEEENLRNAVRALAAEVRRAAARPEGFWQAQREAIAAQLQNEGSRRTARAWEFAFAPGKRLAWAGTLAGVALAAVFLTRQRPPEPRVVPVDPDHALLVEVNRSVRREVPRALEPAALLAQEMSRAAEENRKNLKPLTNTDERR